jgi:hypothetical protein
MKLTDKCIKVLYKYAKPYIIRSLKEYRSLKHYPYWLEKTNIQYPQELKVEDKDIIHIDDIIVSELLHLELHYPHGANLNSHRAQLGYLISWIIKDVMGYDGHSVGRLIEDDALHFVEELRKWKIIN